MSDMVVATYEARWCILYKTTKEFIYGHHIGLPLDDICTADLIFHHDMYLVYN